MRILLACAAMLAASGCVAIHADVDASDIKAKRCGAAGTKCIHPDEADILATVDRFLLAIGNHDYAAQAELLVAEGTTFIQRRLPEGDRAVQRRANAEFLKPGANQDPFIERYWEPQVFIRGGLAVVWAPYELRDNGKVVHCGIDSFDLVKLDGKWKIGNLLSTFEPNACTELRPPAVSAMRPRDGWKETPNQ